MYYKLAWVIGMALQILWFDLEIILFSYDII